MILTCKSCHCPNSKSAKHETTFDLSRNFYVILPSQFVRVVPLLIFLAIIPSNAHASAKSASTVLFVTALHML